VFGTLKDWLFPPDEKRVVGFYFVCLAVLAAFLFGFFVFFTVGILGILMFVYIIIPTLLIGPLLAKLFTIYPVVSSILLILLGIHIIPGMNYMFPYGTFVKFTAPGLAIASGVISIFQVYLKKV
jgi:hypothetical protein